MEGCRWVWNVSWWGNEFISTGLYDRMQIRPLVWNLCVYWRDLEPISYILCLDHPPHCLLFLYLIFSDFIKSSLGASLDTKMTERDEIESLPSWNMSSSGRRQTYKQHRFTRDEKCAMPEACRKCHGMMEEGVTLLSERVKGGDIQTSHCSRMKVCLGEVTACHGGLKRPGVF